MLLADWHFLVPKLRIGWGNSRDDSRSVDREKAEAWLAAISAVLPACEEEIRQRLPELQGKVAEAEAFRLALRKLGFKPSYETYRYIQWRLEENRSSTQELEKQPQVKG